MAAALAAVLAVTFAGGCLDAASPQDPAGAGPAGTGAGEWSTTIEGCSTAIALVTVDLEAAQAALPPGYNAKDPGHALGLGDDVPPTTGTGTLILGVVTCRTWSATGGPVAWLQAAVDIDPPTIEGYEQQDAHEQYAVALATDTPQLAERWAQQGLPAPPVNITVDHARTAEALVASGAVRDEDGVLLELELVATGADESGWTSDLYYETPRGVGLWETDEQRPVLYHFGQVATCELRAGSVLAAIVGSTDCAPRARLSVAHTEASHAWRERFLPGASASAAGGTDARQR